MKFLSPWLTFLALIFGGVAVSVEQSEAVVLARNGASDYVILIPESAGPPIRYAARELQKYLEQISGAKLPIAEGTAPRGKPVVIVGEHPRLNRLGVKRTLKSLGPEGFIIRTSGRNLILCGGGPRGTVYSVYTFLEEVLGCRWFAPGVDYVPKKSEIVLQKLNIQQKPAFEYREPFFTEAFDRDWAVKLKMNGNSQRLDEETGGHVVYGPFVHTFYSLIPPQEFFKDHPEYFSLINGKRQFEGGQLCLTNPDVLRICTERVLKWMEEMPQATIFSASQNDWYGACQCDKCQAVVKEEGAESGLMLRFVNAIAEVTSKKYPDKLIDTLAYQYTEKPPLKARPHPNVRVRMCPIGACQAHPYEKCPENATIVENLKAWSKITNQLYIWHYNTNFAHYLLPFPDFDELAADIDMYHRHGVKGMFMQGAYAPGGGGEFAIMRSYMMAKLLWNPKADAHAILDEFMQGYYGKAAPAIKRYFDRLHRKVREENIHFRIFDPPTVGYLTPDVIEASDRDFDEAERLAADDPVILDRVQQARLSLDYVHLTRDDPKTHKQELLALLDRFEKRLEKYGITQISEWRPKEEDLKRLRERIEKGG